MRRALIFTILLTAGCKQVVIEPPEDPTEQLPPDEIPDTSRPECQIASSQEHTPGWPFDLPTFREKILPVFVEKCADCHAPLMMPTGFTVWRSSAPGTCGYAQTFNSMQANVDLANPSN